MCCFSPIQAPFRLLGFLLGPPQLEVSSTKIFARVDPAPEGGPALQWLAYSMAVATPSDVAMVLPIPAARAAEDALRFIDLSGYPTFFTDLETLFPDDVIGLAKSRGGFMQSRSRPRLVVHAVGDFEASYVPSLGDFDRLDPRFRIPQAVWDARPDYGAFGFAVFKLKKGKKKSIHPMAFSFETGEPRSIFFPTLHVHDGVLHEEAHFDHKLYYQAEGAAEPVLEGRPEAARWVEPSSGTATQAVDVARTRGLVDGAARVMRWGLHGMLPNRDARVKLPIPA
ncbi:MAG: hypothetical protein U0359_33670 [Byssovorax sp.]